MRRFADRLTLAAADKRLACLEARNHVFDIGEEAITTAAAEQQGGACRSGEIMRRLRAGFHFNQCCHRLAITTRARQQRHRHRVHTASAFGGGTEHQQGIHRPAFKGAVQLITRLEGKTRRVMAMATARAYPAFAADHHGDGFINHLGFEHGFFLGLDQRTARVGKLFGVGFDFLDHQPLQCGGASKDFFQPALLFTQVCKFLLDLDGFQPCQLAQADFENVFGLPIAKPEAGYQRRFRLIRLADDGDNFIDVEQHQLPPLKDVDAVQHLVQPMLRAALYRGLAKLDPLVQYLPQGFLRRFAVQPDHGQVDGRGTLQAGMRQQGRDEF